MKIVDIPLELIHVGDRFRQDLGNLEELAESIRAVGLIQPISINEEMTLLAGGRRLAAAKIAGLEKISCVIHEPEDDTQALEIELFENIHRKDMTWPERVNLTAKIHEIVKDRHKGDWSIRKTAKLLGTSHGSVHRDTEMSEALRVMPDLAKAPTEEKARRVYKQALENAYVSSIMSQQKNQVRETVQWADDHYKIGDCFPGLANVAANICHFAEVDPPYGIDLQERKKGTRNIEEYNEVPSESYGIFLRDAAQEVYRVLSHDAFCIWWFAPVWYHTVLSTLMEVGFQVDEIPAIWDKRGGPNVSQNPEVYLARAYEPFFVCRKGNPVLRERGRPNLFSHAPLQGSQKIHPTERPLSLMEELLTTFAYAGARIVVPFLGSGNTLIAAYRQGMIGFGWELSDMMKPHFLLRVLEDEVLAEKEKVNDNTD